MILVLVEVERNIRIVMEKMRNFIQNFSNMKQLLKTLTIVIIAFIAFSASNCNKTPDPPPDNIFSYRDPIVNPPDEFKISFDISQLGDKIATVKFADSSVWAIANQGDSRVTFYMQNPEGEKQGINSTVSYGLRGGVWYTFVANNNNHTELRDFFCKLTKQQDGYDSFNPKF